MGQGTDTTPVSILIVDDDRVDIRAITRALRRQGIDNPIVTAGNGEEALLRLRERPGGSHSIRWPYIVLLDLNMPEKSGIETAREISADQSGDRLPLIAVSAALESVKETELREAGFREVVSKPISPADLYAALERSLQTDFEE